MWAKLAHAPAPMTPSVRRSRHGITQPPLTSIVAPLTKLAPSDARKATTVGDLDRLGETAERHTGDERGSLLRGEMGGHEALDRARRDRVRGDAVRPVVPGEVLHEADHAGLGRAVDRRVREAAGPPADARDADDPAPAVRLHRLGRSLRQEEHGAQVHAGLALVVLERDLGEGMVRDEDGGVVDEDVEAALGRERCRRRRARGVGLVQQVGGDGPLERTALLLEEVEPDDAMARAGEDLGHRPAHAAGAAGDERHAGFSHVETPLGCHRPRPLPGRGRSVGLSLSRRACPDTACGRCPWSRPRAW